jgi:hypothetical protein
VATKHEKSLVMTHGTLLTLHETPNFSLQPSDGLRSVPYRLSSGNMRQAFLTGQTEHTIKSDAMFMSPVLGNGLPL